MTEPFLPFDPAKRLQEFDAAAARMWPPHDPAYPGDPADMLKELVDLGYVAAKEAAMVAWPFDAGAYAVLRPCGCYWLRLGMGVALIPCAPHGGAMAETVRAEAAKDRENSDRVSLRG